jgi:hypothetical protein
MAETWDPKAFSPQPTLRFPVSPLAGIIPPPATWGCHLPPENGLRKKGQHVVLSFLRKQIPAQ